MVRRRAHGRIGRLAALSRCREFAAAGRRKGNPAFAKRPAAAPALSDGPAAWSRCEGRAAARRFPERMCRRDGSRAARAWVQGHRCRTPPLGHWTAPVHERPASPEAPCCGRREAAPPGAVISAQPAGVQRGLVGAHERVARARADASWAPISLADVASGRQRVRSQARAGPHHGRQKRRLRPARGRVRTRRRRRNGRRVGQRSVRSAAAAAGPAPSPDGAGRCVPRFAVR